MSENFNLDQEQTPQAEQESHPEENNIAKRQRNPNSGARKNILSRIGFAAASLVPGLKQMSTSANIPAADMDRAQVRDVSSLGIAINDGIGLEQEVNESERLPVFESCEYILEEDEVSFDCELEGGESLDLTIPIVRDDLPLTDSGYTPTEGEIVFDDDLNPNNNCHSFSIEQVSGIEDFGQDSDIWVNNREMQDFLETYGTVVSETGFYGQPGFEIREEEYQDGDILALYNQDGELIHTGVYMTEFEGVDTSAAPNISKFGTDKLTARGIEFTIEYYWINVDGGYGEVEMRVYRFDESFDFEDQEL